MKRKYINKAGETIIYTYGNNKGYSTYTLVGITKGKPVVYTKRIEKVLARARDTMSDAEYTTFKNNLNTEIKNAKKDKRKLTERSAQSRMATSKIKKLFINAGTSVEEVAREYDISEIELLNLDNWKGDTFKYDGNNFQVKFDTTYMGRVLFKVG